MVRLTVRLQNQSSTSAEALTSATHIYRRIDGEWYLVHRHADSHPPISAPEISRTHRWQLGEASGARYSLWVSKRGCRNRLHA